MLHTHRGGCLACYGAALLPAFRRSLDMIHRPGRREWHREEVKAARGHYHWLCHQNNTSCSSVLPILIGYVHETTAGKAHL
ncbi:hypothetical protein LZ32DRAFT_372953 [Colletotrichum eremochloae]|nr:hypothetical protein LZ32DRAFT_372953 [Colletotrichum eremochloae]